MNPDLITIPTLLLDPIRCKKNLQRMTEKAKSQNVLLRPHFKTHQSHLIGRWFSDEGIDKITVSSVGMAHYFASDGWNDITIAFPVNVRQIEEIKTLSEKIKLGLLVLDCTSIVILGNRLQAPVNIWIKIDVGTHRTGIGPMDSPAIDAIIEQMKAYPQLRFAGFLGHAGHTYQSRQLAEVQLIYDQALNRLIKLKDQYASVYPDLKISLGDTPGASMVSHFGKVDELRPGNFIFYDLMQVEIGACTMDDIAVTMACPVVAVHPNRLQWIIYGGAIHFSKDYLLTVDNKKCFGRMVEISGQSWSAMNTSENPYLVSLSQEHGVVQCTDENFHLCKPGDISLWLPVHSCLTADAIGEYLSTDGERIDHYRKHVFK